MRGGNLVASRYIFRQATMVDLISNAWKLDSDFILGGPSWLDTNRFEVNAQAPQGATRDDARLMLRGLLADRFSLVVHTDTRSMPAFALTAPKGAGKMKDADASADSKCEFKPPEDRSGPLLFITFECHNRTMAQLAEDLKNWDGGDYLNHPTVDQTNLKGAYDFTIRWTPKGQLGRAGGDAITLPDAVDKELGLHLEAVHTPLSVLIVDSVNQKPTPNLAGLDKLLPPPPPAEFDVAVIKPASPDEKGLSLQMRGGQVNINNAPLQFMITWAWNLNPNDKEAVANAPKGLSDAKFDILAKIAPAVDPTTGKSAVPNVDIDDLQSMIRILIGQRFNLKMHMEDRPEGAYTLVAVGPHMKKGDPLARTGCKEGPGPDGKDPRIADPILGRLLTCTNMSMAEFGEELRTLAGGYIFAPVVDSTGLDGGYDFTLSFSTAGQLTSIPAPKESGDNSASASDPSGGLSLFDAMQRDGCEDGEATPPGACDGHRPCGRTADG